MPVASGKKRCRLTLHAPEGTYGDGTERDVRRSISAVVEKVPLQFQRQESLVLGGQNVQTLYLVVIEYLPEVTHRLQLVEECCTHRVFEILQIVPDTTMRELELTCVVGQR